MAILVLEDGTGTPNANSYVSLADAQAFIDPQGYEIFTSLADEEKCQLLIIASHFVDAKFRTRFRGTRLKPPSEQGLFYPRDIGDGESSDIPIELKYAVMTFAVVEKQGGLHAASSSHETNIASINTSDQQVRKETLKVGTFEESFEYTTGPRSSSYKLTANQQAESHDTESTTLYQTGIEWIDPILRPEDDCLVMGRS